MRILLVEDDAAKRQTIEAFLRTQIPDVEFLEARSFRAAMDVLTAADTEPPEVILLDMTIPAIDNGSGPNDLTYGGRDVLRQVRRLGIRADVVVVTSYDRFDTQGESMTLSELDQHLASIYPEHYRGSIAFSFRYDSWKGELAATIQRVMSP